MKLLITFFLFFNIIFASSLHFAMRANPSRINPILSTDSVSSEISQWIFNSLITYDENASIKSELASSYKFLDDITLIFTLRDDVFWSDGEKFTAKDVFFTYETILSPNIFTPYSEGFKHVKNVELLDDYNIKITYKYPYFKALEIWMMGILPWHILKDEKDLMTSKFNQNPIGTGPYIIEEFSLSRGIKLRANENYFLGKPSIDSFIYSFVPDSATAFLMLKSGQLDYAELTPMQLKKQVDSSFFEKFNIYETISYSYAYIGFNLNLPIFQDKRVREAISLSINRDEIVDIILFGEGEVATGPFLSGTKAFNENIKAPKQYIKKEKELLGEAGYNEKNPLKFELVTNSGSRTYVAQIIQSQLKNSGIDMKIRVLEWQAFLNTVVMPKNYDAVLLAWSLGIKPDAYQIWHSESTKMGGFNIVSYKNEKVDELIKLAEKEVNEERFSHIYQEIFKLIANDNPYIFLYIPNTITAIKKDIKGVKPSIIGIKHNILEWKIGNF
ncbi:MAG: peptide-binding protein [Campylobacteraceae bacterium]